MTPPPPPPPRAVHECRRRRAGRRRRPRRPAQRARRPAQPGPDPVGTDPPPWPARGGCWRSPAGTGEHAVHFAAGLPHLTWQTTDRDADLRASVAAHRAAAGLGNLAAPLALDAAGAPWPVEGEGAEPFDAVFCANMIHIAPWAAAEGLLRGGRGRPAPRRPADPLRPVPPRRRPYQRRRTRPSTPACGAEHPGLGRARPGGGGRRGVAATGWGWSRWSTCRRTTCWSSSPDG